MLAKRSSIFLVGLGIFLAALLIASRRLNGLCVDGIYCRTPPQDSQKPPDHPDAHHVDVGDKASWRSGAPPPHTPPSFEEGNHTAPASHQAPIDRLSKPAGTTESDCANFPDTSTILLVMKTGASEAYARIPTQTITNLKCLPEFLIFGDLKQEIGGYKIHDSLERVLTSVKQDNQDFNIYFRQQQCSADQEGCNKEEDTASEGWALDKYKNVHIAEKTYELRPHYDWYLFTDADTYVSWPNIVQWLTKLDPKKPMYFGSVAMLGDFPFAHGGSGYVVSRAAMEKFFKGKKDVATKWDEEVRSVCCGDYMFSKALKDATGIAVQNTWPYINGEKPFTIPYAEDEWCQTISTMHHVGSEELSDLDAFERERNFKFPLRIKDLYHRFVKSKLESMRQDWDNLSDDRFYLDPLAREYEEWQINRSKKEDLSDLEKEAHLSADHCQRACEADKDCLQFRLQKGICGFSRKIKYGHPSKEHKSEDRSVSGWVLNKIEAWERDHEHCDDKIDWPLVPKSASWRRDIPERS